MTVLRDRTSDPGEPQDQQDEVERQLCRPTAESAEEPPSRKTEANFCNGNGVVGSSTKSPRREEILNSLIAFAECLKRRRGMEKYKASSRNSFSSLFVQLLGFGSEPKRSFSDLKVGDFLHREKQTMAVSPFFLLSSFVLCCKSEGKTAVKINKRKTSFFVL